MAYNPVNPNGQTTMSNSSPVVIASDQTAVPGNITQVAGNSIVTAGANGIIAVGGPDGVGNGVSTNPIQNGIMAYTSLTTSVSNGQIIRQIGDIWGRAVTIPFGTRDIVSPITSLTLTATTTETTLVTQISSTFIDLVSLSILNTSATATQVDFRDSTGGTIRFSVIVPGGDIRGISFTTPLPQSTSNNNWTAKCGTSVSSVIITGHYIKNK